MKPRSSPSCPDCERGFRQRRVDNYDRLRLEQNDLCAICRSPETGKNKGGVLRRLSVDHDHATGAIRALLCSHCNRMLGHARESIEVLESAIGYLKRHAV